MNLSFLVPYFVAMRDIFLWLRICIIGEKKPIHLQHVPRLRRYVVLSCSYNMVHLKHCRSGRKFYVELDGLSPEAKVGRAVRVEKNKERGLHFVDDIITPLQKGQKKREPARS